MLGGRGAVIAVANVFPELCSSLYNTFKRGSYGEASEIQRRVSYVNEVLVKRYNQISAIKEALRLRGLPGGYPRKPVLPLEEKERREIEEFMKLMLESS